MANLYHRAGPARPCRRICDNRHYGPCRSFQYRFYHSRIIRVCEIITAKGNIQVLPGLELTHVDPADIATLVSEARKLGAQILIVHGETLTEPVPSGTNLAAIQAGADILAHPGLITEEEVRLAASKGVHLEITTRRGHSLTNGHVASMARKCGALLVLNNDTHAPGDFVGPQMAANIARGARGCPKKKLMPCSTIRRI